jgi:precorrin-6B methylase 2
LLCPLFAALAVPGRPAEASSAPSYEWRSVHDPDGTGKFYEGREIAQVMGHQGADWLERPEREAEERPSVLLQSLQIRAGDMIADIGAGSGYLSLPLARLTGPSGRVYAVDIQQEMIDLLSRKLAAQAVTNVAPVLGTLTNAQLAPASIDLAILVDVYHEFSYPFEMMQSICRALKPGGRVVFVEYRGENPEIPIKPVHKMTEAQVRKEMRTQPLTWVQTSSVLPRQHIIIFKRKR